MAHCNETTYYKQNLAPRCLKKHTIFHLKILLYLAILGENEVKYTPCSLFQHKKKSIDKK